MAGSSGSFDRRDLALAALVVVTGLLIFGWMAYSALSGIGGDLVQMAAPGTAELDLEKAGEYTIFREDVSVVEGRFYSTGETVPPGLVIELFDLSYGEMVDLSPPFGSSTYTFAGRSGRSIAAFEIDHPGVYRMTASYPPGREGPEVVLAVGTGLFGGIASKIVFAVAALFGSIVAGAAILIRGERKREEEEERLREEDRIIRRKGI
ncbi:MAG: hypothetical protein WBK88_01195 [Methanothrix sp.]